MYLGFRCRAYPDQTQQAALHRTFGCVRLVWNRTLAARRSRYAAERKDTSYAETDRSLTLMKRDPGLEFLNQVSAVPLQQALRHQKRLKRYQRRLARCQKGSANRAKARVKVARVHAKIADARQDFLHKTTTGLIRRFDVIAIEDLNISGMVRNRRLARAICCTGWGEHRRMLNYKAERYGRTIAVVDRWYPSSKTCSACGHVLAELGLEIRHWTCPACGTRHNRDVNAAKNILAAGLAVTACGGDVGRSGASPAQAPAKQETQRARAPGILAV